ATGKREQRKFTCFAEREWVRATKGIKRQALLEDNVNNIFERNLNSFLYHVSKSIYNERIAMQSRLQIVCKLRAVMCACITSCFV
ncbi:MAG: hypothetical protein IKW29_06445, partial [Bacteroidaceae bacterium]|nr:hypothetical protein [Bacteroidaceae bacterium]